MSEISLGEEGVSRRDFLRGVAAVVGGSVTLGGPVGFYLRATESMARQSETDDVLNIEILREHVYSVSPSQAAELIRNHLLSDLSPEGLTTEDFAAAWDKVSVGIKHIEQLRNCAVFYPDVAEDIAKALMIYNVEPLANVEDDKLEQPPLYWDQDLLLVNHLQVLKYESFLALRYLEQTQGVDLGSANYQFSGWITWNYYDTRKDRTSPKMLDSMHAFGSDREHVSGISDLDFSYTTEEKNSLEYTNALIQKHWAQIKKSANQFDVDPMFLAALISMEARDEKVYYLYHSDEAFEQGSDKLWSEGLLARELLEDGGVKYRLSRIIGLFEEHRKIAQLFVPQTVREEVVDVLGGVLGANTSIGLGQIRPQNAKRLNMVIKAGFGRKVGSGAPEALWSILLTNPALNIAATAATVRQLIDGYEDMGKQGLNLYLPDLAQYNPSVRKSGNKLEDPFWGENFGIAAFGAWYNDGPYPSLTEGDSESISHVSSLREIPNIDGWGAWVAAYHKYYHENASKLGLD